MPFHDVGKVKIPGNLSPWHKYDRSPAILHFPPPASTQWAGIIATLYPLSVGYAILRYQLFDIRVVIRKGLVYSLLTATLTAVFLILSLVTGYLFQGLTGRQSLLVALLPALFVAVLFQPARGRIQTLVDRAFFRREYEVRQTLTAFSQGLSTLRERGEVARLVLNTVTETLGAGGATLWLLDDKARFVVSHKAEALSGAKGQRSGGTSLRSVPDYEQTAALHSVPCLTTNRQRHFTPFRA